MIESRLVSQCASSGAVTQIDLKKVAQAMHNIKSIFLSMLLSLFVFSLLSFSATGKCARSNQHPNYLVGSNAVGRQSDEKKKTPTIAILLFDRVEIIDFAGPWKVFGGRRLQALHRRRET